MDIVYAQEPLPTRMSRSLFLAGPTPRSKDVKSWRENALAVLQSMNFDGHVFVPEPRNGKWDHDYLAQVEWEAWGEHYGFKILNQALLPAKNSRRVFAHLVEKLLPVAVDDLTAPASRSRSEGRHV